MMATPRVKIDVLCEKFQVGRGILALLCEINCTMALVRFHHADHVQAVLLRPPQLLLADWPGHIPSTQKDQHVTVSLNLEDRPWKS